MGHEGWVYVLFRAQTNQVKIGFSSVDVGDRFKSVRGLPHSLLVAFPGARNDEARILERFPVYQRSGAFWWRGCPTCGGYTAGGKRRMNSQDGR